MIPRDWSLDPVALAAAGVALALYVQAFARLRRRGRTEHTRVSIALLFAGGVAVGILAVVSPLDELAEDTLLSAHMLQHLLIGDVAPLLLVLGARGPIAYFLLPPRVLRRVARLEPLRLLLRPGVSFGVWAGALAVWHVPAAYDAALAHPALHALEHASLLFGGLLLWTQIVDPTRRARLTPGRRAAFALAALAAGTLLAELLLASAPLYPHYAGADRPFGLTYAGDQSTAEVLMMVEQAATLGVAAALLFWRHVETLERRLAT